MNQEYGKRYGYKYLLMLKTTVSYHFHQNMKTRLQNLSKIERKGIDIKIIPQAWGRRRIDNQRKADINAKKAIGPL